eukprot:611746-Pleurochrysis_carterae.AAC.1
MRIGVLPAPSRAWSMRIGDCGGDASAETSSHASCALPACTPTPRARRDAACVCVCACVCACVCVCVCVRVRARVAA